MASVLDLLYQWQSLEAGILALAAAISAITVTRNIELRRVSRELDVLRRSLAIELRILARQSLSAYESLQRSIADPDNRSITIWTVESTIRLGSAIVYTNNAHKIALLEGDALDLAVFYGFIELVRDVVDRTLIPFRPSNNIPKQLIGAVAKILFQACGHAATLMPRLRTGVAFYDNNDDELIRKIRSLTSVEC